MMACHQPLTLLHIAFAPGQIFCVACIDQENFQSRLFQDVERLRFTLHLLVDWLLTEQRALLWTGRSWILVKTTVLVVIRVSTKQSAVLPATDSSHRDLQFFRDLREG